jgi:3-hydroxybutyryl-CoA dehydratase
MSEAKNISRGWYFEEFEVGQRITTGGRTVTEADIVAFAALSGDYSAIHTDAEYSRTTPFGRRVAHGLLGLSIASGLAVNTGLLEGTVLAFRDISSWKFSLPVFIGDTIHVVMEIEETKSMPRLDGGSVVISLNVLNQDDKTVMKGRWSVLIKSRA